jgi:hypothetical protein
MALRARNYSDKSLWNPANGALNAVMVPTLGEVSSIFQNIGATSPPLYGSQDDLGKKVCIDLPNIASYTNASNGTLFEGMYQAVQIDSAATVASCGVGRIAYHLITTNGQNVVTSVDQATSTALMAGVFLTPNPVAGYYTVIFVGAGRVNVAFNTLTNGAPAIGDNIVAGAASGYADDASAKTVAPTGLAFAKAVTAPVASTTSTVFMSNILNRI